MARKKKYYRWFDFKTNESFVATIGTARKIRKGKRGRLSKGAEEKNPLLQKQRGWKVHW